MTGTSKVAGSAVWKPLVICPNGAIAGRIAATLRAIAGAVEIVSEYPRLGSAAPLVAAGRANVCLVDAVTNPEHAQAIIAELAWAAPVVALLSRNDGDLILRCLRRGAREFLADYSEEAVAAALNRLAGCQSAAPAATAGSLICVVPGKPGSGASTVAVHLAMQARGSGSVLLVDTDSLGASLAFQLKLKNDFHLGSLLKDWKRIDAEMWSRFVAQTSGIDVLTAPMDARERVVITRQWAAEAARFWRERYRTVIVDTADAHAAVDMGIPAVSDLLLLVTTNELAALHATRRALECLSAALSDSSHLRLILNRYTPSTGLSREDVRKALDVAPFATLSNDYETLQSALLEGRPAASTTRFGAGVSALWRQLEGGEPVSDRNSWLKSLLGRRTAQTR